MAQQTPRPETSGDDAPQGDPWQAFGYLVAGVLFYGAVGWGLDWWLGTSYLVAIGIIFGAGLGAYMTWVRFGRTAPHDQHDD